MQYRDQTLYLENLPLADIARREGTPSYVYSRAAIIERFEAYEKAFGDVPHKVCYAVKANSNLSILSLLAAAGAGFDIVSGGELFRALKAGADPGTIIFSGVGKTAQEIDYALDHQIKSFNCESEPELALIDSLAARRGIQTRVALRVNPDVDASTHPYISTGLRDHKFGIDIAGAEAVYERARSLDHLLLEGVSCHIGSQITDIAPMLEVFDKMIALVERLRSRGLPIRTLDLGGGLGVAYKPGDQAPSICEFIETMCRRTAGHNLEILIEPGRSIVATAGITLYSVGTVKHLPGIRTYVSVDGGMSDNPRPVLYGSGYEAFLPRATRAARPRPVRVVGKHCESGDLVVPDAFVPGDLEVGDVLATPVTGAYGYSMASNYNKVPRPGVVFVADGTARVVVRRETFDDLLRLDA